MKLKEKKQAIRLRKLGRSYKEILKDVNASKGTLSLWLRDVKLTKAQKERLYRTAIRQGAYKGAKIKQEKRIKRSQKIINTAEKEAQKIIKNPLFLAGLMLYWAEGDKSAEIERVKFSNSDPAMIEFMMKWFREICRVPESKFRICLHIHELHKKRVMERFWSEITEIPLEQFYKTQVKKTSLRYRKNILYNGTCAIVVNKVDLFREIKGWRLGFLKKTGIKNRK